jgi:hypothetical protein
MPWYLAGSAGVQPAFFKSSLSPELVDLDLDGPAVLDHLLLAVAAETLEGEIASGVSA